MRDSVLQLIDSLAVGGAERVAVNLANDLPRDRFACYLCATRSSGPLAAEVRPDVEVLLLGRRSRADLGAARRLTAFVRDRGIRVVHAHSSSVYIACAVKLLRPGLRVVWHQHLGRPHRNGRPPLLHRLALSRVDAAVAVSRHQAEYTVSALKLSPDRVFLVHNYSAVQCGAAALDSLPGSPGTRIVCLAQLRPEKDHRTLLKALELVIRREPGAHLLIVGGSADSAYGKALRGDVRRSLLGEHVTFLGERRDVPAILAACDIGVLSSRWEGLPISLLEYGTSGMPVVTTDVGECSTVLDGGRCGLLVEPSNPEELARALLRLIASPELRRTLGSALKERIECDFSRDAAIKQLCAVYASL